jgi:hypothetical protein
MKECLEVPRETLEFLKGRQLPVHVLPTADAVKLYNQLAEKEPVGRTIPHDILRNRRSS